MPDAGEWHRLATQYATLAARAIADHESCKAEVDNLRAEIIILHEALADLKATIRKLKDTLEDKAETSGSWAAQEILNRRELKERRTADKERRALRAKVAGGIVVGLVVAIGIFVGGVFWHASTLPEAQHAPMVR